MKNIFQFRNFFTKYEHKNTMWHVDQLLQTINALLKKYLIRPLFQIQGETAWKWRIILLSVGFLFTLVIKLRSLLEDSVIWVPKNANLRGPFSQVNFKLGRMLLRKLKDIFVCSKELKTQKNHLHI